MSYNHNDDFATHGQPDRGLTLDALQRQLLDHLVPALERALGRVDDYLFDRSQNSNDDLGLTALRDLRRVRAQIAKRFENNILSGFRALRDPRSERDFASALSLLSEEALEEQLANEQLAESLTRMHAPGLELLGKRLSHVLGRDELSPVDNPMSPSYIASALRKALEGVEMGASVRIVVFKFFERELATTLSTVYEGGNLMLVKAGVLPYLRPTTKAEAMPPPAPLPGEQVAPQQQAAALSMMQSSPVDQAMFANLLGMLSHWRASTGIGQQPGAGNGPAQVLGSQDLLNVLSLLQREPPAPLQEMQRSPEQSLADQLRREVLQGARKLGHTSDNMQLDGLDEDAVDLVALLFDVLLDGPQFDTDIRRKIGRMLVPYVKVAVKDRRMFLFKEHPARKLLNTVAEACEGNRGEAPQEKELLSRVDDTIDRLVAEFNEDVAIFETLEQELRSFMAQHRKRFELAEKRAAEAQRGRERLDHARSAVSALIAQHRGERELPQVMSEFLSGHAAHHLIQVMLRDGHGSPRFEEAVLAIDDMLLAFDHAELHTPETELPLLPRAQFETILASSGCTGQAATAAIDSLQDALVRLARGERATDNPTRMPEQVLPPEPAPEPDPEPVLEVVAGTDTLDYDSQMLERMRKLQVGHWIQISVNDRVEPAKVSWISPISSRLLLVNRRGIRLLVASAEELAAMAKLGKLSLREGETMFEDAMHQVVDRLKTAAQQV